jgi:hypothetical protein
MAVHGNSKYVVVVSLKEGGRERTQLGSFPRRRLSAKILQGNRQHAQGIVIRSIRHHDVENSRACVQAKDDESLQYGWDYEEEDLQTCYL